MVFKLIKGAQKSWRLDGHALLAKLIQGVKLAGGLEVVQKHTAAKPVTAAA